MSVLRDPTRRRWFGFLLLAAGLLLMNLHRTSTAVLSDQLMQAFDTTATGLGVLHSSFFWLYAVLQVPAGLLTDRYGARAIATIGTTLMSAGAVVFGLASTYVLAFLARLLVGLGASVLFVATLRYCSNWFRPDEFGTMTGLTFSASILGALVATTPLALAITTFGWRSTLFGLGALGLLVALGVVLLSQDSPEAAGLPALAAVPDRPAVTAADLRRYVRRAVAEAETWLLGVMLFLMTGVGVTIFGLWGIPYLVQSYDLSVTEASVYLLLGNLGGLVGPTLFGWLSDRFGRRTDLIVFSTVVFAATWGIFAVFGTIPLFLVGAIFLFTRVLRGGIPLAYTVIKERHPEGASGTVIGIINTMAWLGAAVFPVVLGVALDTYWTGETVNGTRVYTTFGYRVAFAICVVAGLLAAACAVALHRRTRRGRVREALDATGEPTD